MWGPVQCKWLNFPQHSGEQTWTAWHSDGNLILNSFAVFRGKFRRHFDIDSRRIRYWKKKHTEYRLYDVKEWMVWSVLGAPLLKLGWEMKVMEQEANVTNKFWSWVIRKNNVWLFQWVICKEQLNRIFKKLLQNCLFTEKKKEAYFKCCL